MILFVSGRCDIPAYYSDWFYNRLDAGVVDVRNPYNPHQISRIPLHDNNIDVIIFCTKNPIPMLSRLHSIPYPFIFHVTLTPYHKNIEKFVPPKSEIIRAIKKLSAMIGKQRVVVRYDPIFINEQYTVEYHTKAFAKICEELAPYINKVIISFLDMYKNTRKNMKNLNMREMTMDEMKNIGKALGEVAQTHKVYVQTCAEHIDLEEFHIHKGLCMDKAELETICGHQLSIKGKSIREACSCMPSVDIGDYNCCMHKCGYCYANYDETLITLRMKEHDPLSSVLIGHVTQEDTIVIREEQKIRQMELF